MEKNIAGRVMKESSAVVWLIFLLKLLVKPACQNCLSKLLVKTFVIAIYSIWIIMFLECVSSVHHRNMLYLHMQLTLRRHHTAVFRNNLWGYKIFNQMHWQWCIVLGLFIFILWFNLNYLQKETYEVIIHSFPCREQSQARKLVLMSAKEGCIEIVDINRGACKM